MRYETLWLECGINKLTWQTSLGKKGSSRVASLFNGFLNEVKEHTLNDRVQCRVKMRNPNGPWHENKLNQTSLYFSRSFLLIPFKTQEHEHSFIRRNTPTHDNISKFWWSDLLRTSAHPLAFLGATQWLMDIQWHRRQSQSSKGTTNHSTSATKWPHWWYRNSAGLRLFIHPDLTHM